MRLSNYQCSFWRQTLACWHAATLATKASLTFSWCPSDELTFKYSLFSILRVLI